MGVLTINDLKQPPGVISGQRVLKPLKLTTDTDYAAGGYTFTAAAVGMASIDIAMFGPSSGYVAQDDRANNKMMFLYGDNNNAADGPLIEVADGLDALAGLVFRGFVIGTAL